LEETKKENSEIPKQIQEININTKSLQLDYEYLIPDKENKEKLTKELIKLDKMNNINFLFRKFFKFIKNYFIIFIYLNIIKIEIIVFLNKILFNYLLL
jgi:hypothetical protein